MSQPLVDQGILVISCSSTLTSNVLIQGVFATESSPQDINSFTKKFGQRDIPCIPWHINTKYYEADVHFLQLNDKDIVSEEFCRIIQAVVLYFDIESEDSWQSAKNWLHFINEYEAEVKMLVCHSLRESPSCGTKVDVQNWCISNGFELIEIDPSSDDDRQQDDLEDDFHESNSYLRIRQALQAHTWPTLDLKQCPEYVPSSRFQQLLDEEEGRSLERREQQRQDVSERVDSLLNESTRIFEGININALEDSEATGGQFENLFEKFQEMKEKASGLNGDERRIFAEKTALAFWKAMGGDDDELEDTQVNDATESGKEGQDNEKVD